MDGTGQQSARSINHNQQVTINQSGQTIIKQSSQQSQSEQSEQSEQSAGVSTGSFDLGVGVGEGLFGTVYGLCTPLATVYMNYVTKF